MDIEIFRRQHLSEQKLLMPLRLVSPSMCDWCLPLNAAQTSWGTPGVQGYKRTQSVGFLCHTHIITVCVCGTGGGGESDVGVDDENKDPCRSSDV